MPKHPVLRAFLPCLAAGCIQLAAAGPAAAQYSVAGKWGVEPLSVDFELVQNGGVLTSTSGEPLGTIDETTGEFHLDFGPLTYPNCGRGLLDGFVALDSLTFEGTMTYGVLQGPTPHTIQCVVRQPAVFGSRCGNGVFDPGEECEDDNGRDGDCCSSTCAYDAPGVTCTSDNDQCTDDVCDGSGTCNHPQNTAACTLSQGCMTGTCNAGTCEPGTATSAGTPCNADDNECTVDDACDGAGSCAPGEPMDCSACGECMQGMGCVTRFPDQCDLAPVKSTLQLSIAEDDDDRLVLRVRDDVLPDDLGDPTSTTDYTICVSNRDQDWYATARPRLVFTIPGGGTCGLRSCWKTTGSGFRFKDKTLAADGIGSFVASTRGFVAKGRGAGLAFGDALPRTPLLLQIHANDGTERCWQFDLEGSIETDTEYKGSHYVP